MIGLGFVTAIAMELMSFGNFILVKVGALDMNVCPGFEGALTHGQRSYKIFYKSCFCEGQLEGTSQCKPPSSSPSQTLVLCIDRLEPWTRTQLVRYHVLYILDPLLTKKIEKIVDVDGSSSLPEDLEAHSSDPGEDIRALLSQPTRFGARFQMVLFTLLGATAMLCHHLFYDHLDGTEVEPDFVIDARLRLTKQALIGQAGNTIATVASIAFGAAIGIAFVQVLWASLGQKSHSIREIQAIMECRTRPYSPGAWHAWGVSRKLTLLAVFGSLMALITIFAPSSLRTIQEFTDPEHCTVSRVDLAGEGYDKQYNSTDGDGLPSTSVTTSQELRKLVSRNLMDGAYLSPQNPLNRSVSYFLEFNAPAMNCTDTTSDFDFTYMVQNSTSSEVVIWNSTHDIYLNGSTIWVAIMGGPDASSGRAITCEVYNATYSVDISHNGTETSVYVVKIEWGQRLSDSNSSAPEYKALQFTALTLGQKLDGFVKIATDTFVQLVPPNDVWDITENNFILLYSTLGEAGSSSSTVPWLWDPNLPDALSELATNVSISLLSNPLGIPMINFNTDCQYPGIIYVYNRLHLLLTYGLGLLTAICCVSVGFYSVSANKREETIHFSRLLVAILDADLGKGKLTGETRFRTVECESGAYSQFINESAS